MFTSVSNILCFLEIAIIRFCQQHLLNALLSFFFVVCLLSFETDLHKFFAFWHDIEQTNKKHELQVECVTHETNDFFRSCIPSA